MESGKRELPGEIQQLPSVLFSNDGHSRLQIRRVSFLYVFYALHLMKDMTLTELRVLISGTGGIFLLDGGQGAKSTDVFAAISGWLRLHHILIFNTVPLACSARLAADTACRPKQCIIGGRISVIF